MGSGIYLLMIEDGIEPNLIECHTTEEQLCMAQTVRRSDPEKDHSLFKLTVINGIPKIDTFSGEELEEE